MPVDHSILVFITETSGSDTGLRPSGIVVIGREIVCVCWDRLTEWQLDSVQCRFEICVNPLLVERKRLPN